MAATCTFTHTPSPTICFATVDWDTRSKGFCVTGTQMKLLHPPWSTAWRLMKVKHKKWLSLFFVCFNRHCLTPAYLTLSTGTITIVREGCVPAAKVRQIFDRVKSAMVWLSLFFREPLHAWFPTWSASSAPPFPVNNLRTLYEQHEKDWVKAGVLLVV